MTQTTTDTARHTKSWAINFLLAAGVVMFLGGALLAAVFPAHAWTGALRWTGLAVIALAGYRRSTLTYWIFFSMLLGVEIGLDRPALAEHL